MTIFHCSFGRSHKTSLIVFIWRRKKVMLLMRTYICCFHMSTYNVPLHTYIWLIQYEFIGEDNIKWMYICIIYTCNSRANMYHLLFLGLGIILLILSFVQLFVKDRLYWYVIHCGLILLCSLLDCVHQSLTLAVVRWPTASENWFRPVIFVKYFQ